MALTQTAPATGSFAKNVRRNIRAVLAIKGMETQAEAAARLGWSEPKFTSRITGDSRWLAEELAMLAGVLGVSVDVLVAKDESEFRDRLSRSGWRSVNAMQDPDDPRIPLLSDDLTPYNAEPRIAIAS